MNLKMKFILVLVFFFALANVKGQFYSNQFETNEGVTPTGVFEHGDATSLSETGYDFSGNDSEGFWGAKNTGMMDMGTVYLPGQDCSNFTGVHIEFDYLKVGSDGQFIMQISPGDGIWQVTLATNTEWTHYEYDLPAEMFTNTVTNLEVYFDFMGGFGTELAGIDNIVMTGTTGRINGTVFFDIDDDGVFDAEEYGLAGQKVQLSPGGITTFTNALGKYYFNVDPDTYDVTSLTESPWVLTTQATLEVEVTSDNLIVDDNDFGVNATSEVIGVDISLAHGTPRCNMATRYWINYQNLSVIPINGEVVLELDELTPFVSSSPEPTSIDGNTITWDYADLYPTSSSAISVNVQMPDETQMGNEILSSATITTTVGEDTYTKENIVNEVITCSYDPNDKSVLPKGTTEFGVISKDAVPEYVIRFQNEGNAEAYDIEVRDQIDENLDISTLQVIGNSHDVEVFIEEDRWVSFMFKDIMLTYKDDDELESQGFIKYRIELNEDVLPNAPVNNYADIYFDFNPAIVTNNVLNTVECYIVPETPVVSFEESELTITSILPAQWYFNEEAISEATNNSFDPADYGLYSVEVTDENGCTSISDAYNYTFDAIFTVVNLIEEPVENVIVEVGDEQIPTDQNGVATFSPMLQGEQEVNINSDDYVPYTLIFTMIELNLFNTDISINALPTDVNLSNLTIDENQPVQTEIATLSTSDVDGDSHTYSLVTGSDNFEILDNKLLSSTIFDYDVQTEYNITVETNDGDEGTFSKDFVISIGDVTSVNELQNSYNIYPNPTTGIFNLNTVENINVEITDITGKTIYSSDVNSKTTKIDISAQPKGIYFLKIKSDSQTISEKIILN